MANIEVRDESKVVWLSQTTLSVDETMETVGALKSKFPNLLSPPSDDICYATQNRQIAVKKLAEDAELVIVVGSKNSSNSIRMVEVALDAGADAAHLVDFASEIDEAWLEGVTTVGLTSGASVPDVLVDGVLEWLAERGYEDVETVKTADESITFSSPRSPPGPARRGRRPFRRVAGHSARPARTVFPWRSSAWTSAVQGSRALPWTWTEGTWRRSATKC